MDKQARHRYEYEVDLDSGTAPARVVHMVGQGKRVLEIGAGPGSITRVLIDAAGCHVTAAEIDTDALNILSSFCEHVYQVDLNDISWPRILKGEGPFEVIVAADVLEHLYDPWSSLKAARELITDDGYIVVSLPHAGHSAILACLMEDDFEYRDWGLLDRTHIRFFGMNNIQCLFEEAGFKIIDAEFVNVRPESTEFAERWQRLPRRVRRTLTGNRFGMVYQVVVKAAVEDSPIQGISLRSLPVETRMLSSFRIPAPMRALGRVLVGSEKRARIRRFANQLGISVLGARL
jgi:2-polyprenyl-3-methyl-5-hydroxy-6-metoxy-1,4-benzoquinol methylase